MADYAELQVTTNFTFLRGASHPEEMAAEVKPQYTVKPSYVNPGTHEINLQ